ITSLGMVESIVLSGSQVEITLKIPTPRIPSTETLRAQVIQVAEEVADVTSVVVRFKPEIPAWTSTDKTGVPGVKNIVAIGSGKGGVGKSTIAANLAVGLAKLGARVGLVDGDVYGPSIPIMMGRRSEELKQRDGKIIPIEAHGVKFMSMGFLAQGEQPLIWRGPMAHRAVQESLMNVDWGELDYLLVDMPPGTGDVHLTLVQTVALVGAVIISTPQDVGLTISMKTLKMFEQTNVKTLGLIENMSYHLCSHCGEREEIFGHGMVAREAAKMKIPFLGEIPLDVTIRRHADEGTPVISAQPEAPASRGYMKIIDRLAKEISIRAHFHKPLTIVEEPETKPQSFSV
ncbi:MAG TPA: Mrp/NBP35 family ATP-binding protein, partial [Nitrospiria bacterium]|nr:Mrp/NBP35 family ATP-binding protein [Nitrospiria bacterium]